MKSTTPAREAAPRTWRSALTRVLHQITADRLPIIAAGVAFYGLLAMIPTMVAIVSIVGIAFDPDSMAKQIEFMSQLLPDKAANLVRELLQQLTSAGRGALGFGTAGSIAFALWTSSSGVRTLMQALNVAYDLEEGRSLPARIGLSVVLAALVIVGMLLSLTLIVLLPIVGNAVSLGDGMRTAIGWLRWPIAVASFWIGLLLLYRFGPDRGRTPWSWMDRGAAVAIAIWLAASLLFSLYVSHFGTFNRTYGSMGAVVVLLLWFLLSAWAVLIGAEINSELAQPKIEPGDRENTTAGSRK
ncbi:YihY/virulence factor BrkB family protein [Rhizobacter fulvus]|jgi:membrane protein